MSSSALLAHAAGLLAHQGGWDEALFVAVPMVIVAVLLKLAKRRMAAATEQRAAAEDDDEPPASAEVSPR